MTFNTNVLHGRSISLWGTEMAARISGGKKAKHYSSIFLLPPSCAMLFTWIDPNPAVLSQVATSFFACIISHVSVRKWDGSRLLHVFTVFHVVGGKGSQRGAELEGSESRSGLKICVTARIRESKPELCYLKEADLCGADCWLWKEKTQMTTWS